MTSGIVAVALAASLGSASGIQARAGVPDTWQDVATAGRLAGQDINRLTTDLTQKSAKADPKTKQQIEVRLAAVRKIQPLVNKLERDQTFAKQVFEAADKGRPEGVASILSRELGAPVRATELRDFFFAGAFTVSNTTFHFCIATAKACGDNHDQNFSLEADR
jgi:hypothetical protein